MRFVRALALILAFSAWNLQAQPEGSRESESADPLLNVSGIDAREALADILDTYERIVKTYSRSLSPLLLRRIEEARGQLFAASEQELAIMGEWMGRELLQLKKHSRRQAAMLIMAPLDDEPYEDLRLEWRTSSPAFPSLRTDVPEYPTGGSIDSSFSEADVEAAETDLENAEEDREDEGGNSGQGIGSVCNRAAMANGRADRTSTSDLFDAFEAAFALRVTEGVSNAVCGQEIAGFSCSVCCIGVIVAKEIQEGLWEATQLCESQVDGAEIEAAYHNTLTIFEGVEHVHGDLELHDSAISDQLAAHNTKIMDQLTAHDSAISGQLASHDTQIMTQVAAHDTKIMTQVAAHDSAVRSELATHDADIKARLGESQFTLDNEIEKRRVHIDVVELRSQQSFLVSTSEAGQAVDVEFLSVQISRKNKIDFSEALGNTSISQVGAGLYVLELSTPPSRTEIIAIYVKHPDTVDHFGQAVFHRDSLLSQ